jgi:hypothetical protein
MLHDFNPFSCWTIVDKNEESDFNTLQNNSNNNNNKSNKSTIYEPHNFNYLENRNYGLTIDNKPEIIDNNLNLFIHGDFEAIKFVNEKEKILFGFSL